MIVVVAVILAAFIIFAVMKTNPLRDEPRDAQPGMPADRRNKPFDQGDK